MKQNRDKILRDKIDSLTELPAGMHVSVESKWELLEAGLPEKKNRRFPVLSLAASLLLIAAAGTMFIWMFQSKNSVSTSVAANTKTTAPRVEAPAQEKGIINEPSVEIAKSSNSRKYILTRPGIKTEFSQSEKRQNIPLPENILINPLAEKTPDIKSSEPIIADITLLKGPQANKPKKRFVEIDFDSPQQETALNKTQPKPFTFKIRLLPEAGPPENTALVNGKSNLLSAEVPF
jgi:hypothetical protein